MGINGWFCWTLIERIPPSILNVRLLGDTELQVWGAPSVAFPSKRCKLTLCDLYWEWKVKRIPKGKWNSVELILISIIGFGRKNYWVSRVTLVWRFCYHKSPKTFDLTVGAFLLSTLKIKMWRGTHLPFNW